MGFGAVALKPDDDYQKRRVDGRQQGTTNLQKRTQTLQKLSGVLCVPSDKSVLMVLRLPVIANSTRQMPRLMNNH